MRLLNHREFSQSRSASRWYLSAEVSADGRPWWRFIGVDGEPVVCIGNPCETCEFFFELRGGRDKEALGSLRQATEAGVGQLSRRVLRQFGAVVPDGKYAVGLFEVRPRKAGSPGVPDYFETEQAAMWGTDHEYEGPRDYYRDMTLDIGQSRHLYEFVIPLQPTRELDQSRVGYFEDLICRGASPTAVSIGVIEVRAHHDAAEQHWIFANYLVDGHHKIEAACRQGTPITILSYVTLDHSWPQAGELVSWYAREDTKQ